MAAKAINEALLPGMRWSVLRTIHTTVVNELATAFNKLPPWVQEIGLMGAVLLGRRGRLLLLGTVAVSEIVGDLERQVDRMQAGAETRQDRIDRARLNRLEENRRRLGLTEPTLQEQRLRARAEARGAARSRAGARSRPDDGPAPLIDLAGGSLIGRGRGEAGPGAQATLAEILGRLDEDRRQRAAGPTRGKPLPLPDIPTGGAGAAAAGGIEDVIGSTSGLAAAERAVERFYAELEAEHLDAVRAIEGAELDLATPFERATAEATRWRDETLASLDSTAEGYDELAARVEAVYLERIAGAAEEAAERQKRAAEDARSGVETALRDYAADAMDTADEIEQATARALGGMEDALVDFVRTGRLSFSSLVDSIIADLARIAVRQAIVGPLVGALGGAFGGGGGGIGYTDAAGYGIGHAGGVAGFRRVARYGVDPRVFIGAPRLHGGGIAGDEVPTILRRREGVFNIVPPELFPDLWAEGEDLLPDRLEEIVHRRAGPQMRMMLDRVAAGAGARGLVGCQHSVGENRAPPDVDRQVGETRCAGPDGGFVPALGLAQILIQPQGAVAEPPLGIALLSERPVAHLAVEGGAGEVAEGMAPGMPDLRPVGPELGLPRLGQAFALRHDVVDRVGGELHGFLAAVVLEPLEHGIAMPEPVHVAARQLRAEGVVGGEGVPVGQGQEVGPDTLDIAVRFDGARSLGEHRWRRGGLVAADGPAHGIGGDQPGQGNQVMLGQTPACIVAVEVKEKGPDRLHAEARQLAKRLGQFRVGLLAEHDRAVVVGTGTEIAGQHLGAGILDPARPGMGPEHRVFLSLLRNLAGPEGQVMADEGLEMVFPAVALEAAFDGIQMIGIQPFLAIPVERHEDEVPDHVGASEVAAAGVHGLEDAVRVVLPLLEVEGDDAELAEPRAQRRDVRAQLLDPFLEERVCLEDNADEGRGSIGCRPTPPFG